MNRRSFLKYSAITSLAFPLEKVIASNKAMGSTYSTNYSSTETVCMFVKPLEKYSYEEIAIMLSEAGFNGADISFRKQGLITPETARTELPKLVKMFSQKNLSTPMAVTDITDPDDPSTLPTLELMKDNGISFYRLGIINYDPNIPIRKSLSLLTDKMKKLEELNARFGIHGAIQNHVGKGFGAAVWDAWTVIKDLDPQYMGFQYDIRHAVAEGAYSWSLALEIIQDFIYTTCIKDFTWEKTDKGFKPVTVPLGQGIVDFTNYFKQINKRTHTGPVSIHYEYPLISSEHSKETVSQQLKKIIPVLRQDIDMYKKMQKQVE